MENLELLEKYGLFDAKVPRYTSYPPANRFEAGIGQRYQANWLASIEQNEPLSIYVHIPFCRRLCWFCACRTQGTKTLRPVEDYVNVLTREIEAVSSRLETPRRMVRLHLGGGTPTLLSRRAMNTLLTTIFDRFFPTNDFEFSVEIDPTEASDSILETLADWGMDRASIGVQDFAKDVQETIGRTQSFEETKKVADTLRFHGIHSLNVDLLYGLPRQSVQSLLETLNHVDDLDPDRIALYGYAHVPHVSKRQVMIPNEALPDPRERFALANKARDFLVSKGLCELGIDHFAKPKDSLAVSASDRSMRRNFQGYTDDPCETLIGFGASAISKFRDGYSQNAVATAAYVERISGSGMAGHRGFLMTELDRYISQMIEDIMCFGEINLAETKARFHTFSSDIDAIATSILDQFPKAVAIEDSKLKLHSSANSLCRIIAAAIDRNSISTGTHSLAI